MADVRERVLSGGVQPSSTFWRALESEGGVSGGTLPRVRGELADPQFAAELAALAGTVAGVEGWGRLGLWAEAAARVILVLRSGRWWEQRRQWPPPPQPSATPDLVCDLAEVLAGRSAHYVHVGPPYRWRDQPGGEWEGWVLPVLSGAGVPAAARSDDEVRHQLIESVEWMSQSWVDEGPVEEPDDAWWARVAELGTDGFFLSEGASLLGEPGRGEPGEAMFRHAVRQVMESGTGRGIGVLPVGQAARIVLHGREAMLTVAVQPASYDVPLRPVQRWVTELVAATGSG